MTLWRWLKNEGIILTKKIKTSKFSNEEKRNIIIEYFSSNQSQTEFVKRYNISPPCISNWIRKFGLNQEDVAIMLKDDEIIVEETITPPRSDQEEIDELMYDNEIGVSLKKTVNIKKVDYDFFGE